MDSLRLFASLITATKHPQGFQTQVTDFTVISSDQWTYQVTPVIAGIVLSAHIIRPIQLLWREIKFLPFL
jgi:hypothetical protein